MASRWLFHQQNQSQRRLEYDCFAHRGFTHVYDVTVAKVTGSQFPAREFVIDMEPVGNAE